MKKGWVDFKRVKGSVTFEQVLAHYGISLKPAKGDELLGLCPFHEDTKPSFRVNTKKRVFHCFGCDAKGNVLDFVARKEGVSIRKAALLLSEWFNIGNGEKEAPSSNWFGMVCSSIVIISAITAIIAMMKNDRKYRKILDNTKKVLMDCYGIIC